MRKNNLQLAIFCCAYSDLDRSHSCFDSSKTQHHKDQAILPKQSQFHVLVKTFMIQLTKIDTKIRPFCKISFFVVSDFDLRHSYQRVMSNYMNKRIRDSSSNDFPKTTKKLQHQPKELQLIVSTSVLIVLLLIWENIYLLTIAYI